MVKNQKISLMKVKLFCKCVLLNGSDELRDSTIELNHELQAHNQKEVGKVIYNQDLAAQEEHLFHEENEEEELGDIPQVDGANDPPPFKRKRMSTFTGRVKKLHDQVIKHRNPEDFVH